MSSDQRGPIVPTPSSGSQAARNVRAPDKSHDVDAWGVRTRLGIVVPAEDVGQESELQELAGSDVRIHTARVAAPERRASRDPREIAEAFAAAPRLDDAVGSLVAASVDAIACAFTSSAYVLGARGEAAMIERLSDRTGAVPVVTSSGAVSAALQALDVVRISIVHPPWFDEGLDERGAAYFDAAGYDVISHQRLGGSAVPRRVDSADVTDLVHAIERHDRPQAVVLCGNEFPAARLVHALEQSLGIHVVTSNQAVFWWLARAAGNAAQPVHGGSLFTSGQLTEGGAHWTTTDRNDI